MNDNAADLRQLNLVVADMSASLDFYRRLGVAVPDGEDAAGPHVELSMAGGLSLELDTGESVGLWHAGYRADPATARYGRASGWSSTANRSPPIMAMFL